MMTLRLGLSGTHTLMLRLGVRLLHALRQFCAQIAGQRAVFAALRPSQGEVDPVVLAASKTLANLTLEWTAFRTLREGNKA